METLCRGCNKNMKKQKTAYGCQCNPDKFFCLACRWDKRCGGCQQKVHRLSLKGCSNCLQILFDDSRFEAEGDELFCLECMRNFYQTDKHHSKIQITGNHCQKVSKMKVYAFLKSFCHTCSIKLHEVQKQLYEGNQLGVIREILPLDKNLCQNCFRKTNQHQPTLQANESKKKCNQCSRTIYFDAVVKDNRILCSTCGKFSQIQTNNSMRDKYFSETTFNPFDQIQSDTEETSNMNQSNNSNGIQDKKQGSVSKIKVKKLASTAEENFPKIVEETDYSEPSRSIYNGQVISEEDKEELLPQFKKSEKKLTQTKKVEEKKRKIKRLASTAEENFPQIIEESDYHEPSRSIYNSRVIEEDEKEDLLPQFNKKKPEQKLNEKRSSQTNSENITEKNVPQKQDEHQRRSQNFLIPEKSNVYNDQNLRKNSSRKQNPYDVNSESNSTKFQSSPRVSTNRSNFYNDNPLKSSFSSSTGSGFPSYKYSTPHDRKSNQESHQTNRKFFRKNSNQSSESFQSSSKRAMKGIKLFDCPICKVEVTLKNGRYGEINNQRVCENCFNQFGHSNQEAEYQLRRPKIRINPSQDYIRKQPGMSYNDRHSNRGSDIYAERFHDKPQDWHDYARESKYHEPTKRKMYDCSVCMKAVFYEDGRYGSINGKDLCGSCFEELDRANKKTDFDRFKFDPFFSEKRRSKFNSCSICQNPITNTGSNSYQIRGMPVCPQCVGELNAKRNYPSTSNNHFYNY